MREGHKSKALAAAILLAMPAGITAQLSDVALFSGYRNDTASFSICSTLSDPDYFGSAKMRFRQINIWEIGAQAGYSFDAGFQASAQISWGQVLGGKVRDTGICDINSNPWNSVFAQTYARCCDCDCVPNTCGCDCPGKESRLLTPVSAYLSGHVWDASASISYDFEIHESLSISPVIGWQYDQQQYSFRNSIFGPFRAAVLPVPCPGDGYTIEPSAELVSLNPTRLLVTSDSLKPGNQDYVLPSTALFAPAIDPQDSSWIGIGVSDLRQFSSCVPWGNCFDRTSYRARWNGGFIGVGFNWSASETWHAQLNYRFLLQSYNGRVAPLGGQGNQQCACNECPQFFPVGKAAQQGQDLAFEFRRSFEPSEMRASSWAYGQMLALSSEWRCDNWVTGLYASIEYRTAPGCSGINPCQSCTFIENPSLLKGNTNVQPIWRDATKQGARWSAVHVGASVAYLF